MESGQQPDRETYRLILFSQDRNDVLVATEEAGFLLPCVEIPRWQRVVEHLTAATRSKYGCVGISLFAPEIRALGDGPYYQAMECVCNGKEHARNTAWKSVSSLTRDSFQEEADYQALQRCTEESSFYEADAAAPFARRGWFAELRSWVTKAIEPSGLQLKEAFRQLNASPTFSLIRFETNGPAVWFKAAGEPNRQEFPVTQELAHLLPAFVPRIIISRSDWNGWLACEVRGANLRETKGIAFWEAAAEGLARLQVASIGKVEPIVEAGARDLRVRSLEALVDPFLDVIGQLMKRQTKVPPARLTTQQLALLHIRIHESLTQLDELGSPDALGQLDLNPGNVIVSAEHCAFLDWAGAYVGQPWLSFQYLVEHFRRTTGDARLQSQLVASYTDPWKRLLPSSTVHAAMAHAPLLAAFAYAAGSSMWRDQDRLQDIQAAGYLRALARRMHLEAAQSVDRGATCLN